MKSCHSLMNAAFAGVLIEFEVVPRGEMADQRLGVEPGEFLFADRKRHHWDVGRLDALIAEFLVERNIGVAIDGGHHRRLLAGRAERLDLGHLGLPIGKAERGVVDHNILVGHPFLLEIGFEDFIGGARIDIIGAFQHPPFHRTAVGAHEIVHRRNGLLVRRGAGIEDVTLAFFAFELNGIEQDVVEFLEYRQHRLARHRGPTAEHDGNFVLADQFARLFGEQRPVRGGIDNDRFELLAQYTAFLVLLGDEHQHHVFQRRFANRHGAGKRMENSDLDGVIGLCGQRSHQPKRNTAGSDEPAAAS